MSKIALKGGNSGTGTYTIEAPQSNTSRTITLPDAAGTVIVGTDGITGVAQGGTGLSSPGTSGNVLISNGTSWLSQAPDAPTTTQVLNATAGASLGAVGSYAMLARSADNVTITADDVIAGSNLRYSGFNGFPQSTLQSSWCGVGGTPSGTWRALGSVIASSQRRAFTLWLRIS
jgi:hypothetical protein